MIATTTGDGAAVPAAFLLAGARLVGDRAVVPDDVADEASALLTVLDELVRAQVDAAATPPASAPAPVPAPAPAPAKVQDATAARRLEGGWRVLGPRGIPGSHRRDLELVLVGPAGVFVGVGVGWVNLRVAGGHLWRGPECADVVLDAVSADADAVRRLLADTGLAPAEVVPLVLATGADPAPAVVRGVAVVGMARLASALLRRGARLEPPAVSAVADVLARSCPPTPRAGGHADPDRYVLAPLRATENDRVMRGLDEVLSGAARPAWAAWLHPEQARVVQRPLAGPALIGGPSGTGKTVAALQRARAAAASGRRVLVTSPVPGVVDAARAQARRIGGQGWDGVELLGLPNVARRLLTDRGDGTDAGAVRDADLAACWGQAWAECGPPPSAASALPPGSFWREEVAEVLGRGLDTEAGHADWCDSRPVLLPEVVRARVWELAEAYRHALRARGLLDTEELYRRALARLAVAHRPLWDTVVVDGAQDCSWAALQLVAALGGTREEGLLLVADPDQACARTPATLGEAGIDLGDRVLALRQDHRAAEVVLAGGRELLSGGDRGARAVATAHPRRSGGVAEVVDVASDDEEEVAVVGALAAARRRSGAAADQVLLVDDASERERWTRVLAEAGLPVGSPSRPGRADGAVRVVTVEDSRGLEATAVFVTSAVGSAGAVPGTGRSATDQAGPALRASLDRARRRRLRVATGRARDHLWVAVRSDDTVGS